MHGFAGVIPVGEAFQRAVDDRIAKEDGFYGSDGVYAPYEPSDKINLWWDRLPARQQARLLPERAGHLRHADGHQPGVVRRERRGVPPTSASIPAMPSDCSASRQTSSRLPARRRSGFPACGRTPTHPAPVPAAPARTRATGVADDHWAASLCLRLQRGCGVRGWGRDGLGTGARGRGARARRALMSTTRPAAPAGAACGTGGVMGWGRGRREGGARALMSSTR